MTSYLRERKITITFYFTEVCSQELRSRTVIPTQLMAHNFVRKEKLQNKTKKKILYVDFCPRFTSQHDTAIEKLAI